MPLLTVAIPFYKGLELLRQTLDSVFAQDFPQEEMEIVLSADKSDQDVCEVLSKAEKARIKIIQQKERLGMVANWNFCMGQGTAPYIYLLHADDRPHVHLMTALVSLLEAHPQGGIAHCDSNVVDANGRVLSKIGVNKWPAHLVYSAGTEAVRHFLYETVACSSIILRRQVVKASGIFSIEFPFSADEEYWPRIAAKWDVIHLRRNLVDYVFHDDSAQANTWLMDNFWDSYVACSKRRLEYLGESLTTQDTKQYFRRLAANAMAISEKFVANGQLKSACSYRARATDLWPGLRRTPIFWWNNFLLCKAFLQKHRRRAGASPGIHGHE